MSRAPVEEPTLVREDGTIGGRTYAHPAFGQIQAHRVTGTADLYGSDFRHRHFMAITISRSQYTRGLSHDWHHPREELVEVWLSEAQWATFVSTPNMGAGTPCTIHRVNRETMPEIPRAPGADQFKAEVREKLEGLLGLVREARAEVEAQSATLGAKKREAITKRLAALEREVQSNLPWLAQVFGEHMESTVEKAKVEVNAYMTAAVHRAGLEALGGHLPLSLPGPEEEGAVAEEMLLPEKGERL